METEALNGETSSIGTGTSLEPLACQADTHSTVPSITPTDASTGGASFQFSKSKDRSNSKLHRPNYTESSLTKMYNG